MTAIAQDSRGKPAAVAPRMILALGLAGLLSGLLIVIVFEATLPMIEANRAAATRRAVFLVVPGSSALQKLVWKGDTLEIATKTDAGEFVYAGYSDDGSFLGYAIPGEGAGFQDTIRLIYGFDPVARRVVGMDVLESKETPGLGDKIYKDKAFVDCFSKLAVEPNIVVVKNGTRSKDYEVDGITGATISSKAVVKILNASNAMWLVRLPAPGSEPALQIQSDESGEKEVGK
jgi:H+/Na+-translocating ferredoxin:NAD+ oxidoreductase subunit G